MTHLQTLLNRIEDIKQQISTHQTEVNKIKQQIAEMMRAESPNEQKVDSLQQERESIVRKVERLSIQLQGAEEGKPEAAREDAAIWLDKAVKDYNQLPQKSKSAIADLKKALEQVKKCATLAFQPYRDSIPLDRKISEKCLEHHLPTPTLPKLQDPRALAQLWVDNFSLLQNLDERLEQVEANSSRRFDKFQFDLKDKRESKPQQSKPLSDVPATRQTPIKQIGEDLKIPMTTTTL